MYTEIVVDGKRRSLKVRVFKFRLMPEFESWLCAFLRPHLHPVCHLPRVS